jgi:hypothetical protein
MRNRPWLCAAVLLLASGCTSPADQEEGQDVAYGDTDEADSVSVEQALVNRDNGQIGTVQLSYRSTMRLAAKVGVPCDQTAVIMTAVARAESGFRVKAIGGPNGDGTLDYGVWQINSVHKFSPALLMTAAYNAQKMADLSDNGSDRGAWASYSSGRYKKYMPYAQQAFDTYHCDE